MDRSKFAVPRWRDGRAPKGAEKLQRPSVELYTVILHGRSVNIYLADESQTLGASWALEIWCRSVEKAWQAAIRKCEPFPSHCVLWGDNTSRELRNSCCHRFFSALTCAGIMKSCSLKHLPVGHTHEDIGSCPGISVLFFLA